MSEEKNILSTISRYGASLLRFIRGRVNSPEEAEDILQDVWYQLSRLSNLDEIESLSGWLYRVARNRITDRYRRPQPDSLDGLLAPTPEGDLPLKAILLASDDDPNDVFFRELFWEELMQALDELPENQRQVFIWNELEDLTLQEIADRTNENLKTVISRKRYAVLHLRQRLQDLYDELKNA